VSGSKGASARARSIISIRSCCSIIFNRRIELITKRGFPLHPHRGIETVTYLLAGAVRHKDTLGNAGEIGPGDLQWMTAGRGILHEEMPQVRPEGVAGFQLWVNLPAKQKMIAPRYQNISASEIAEIRRDGGATIRVIAGTVDSVIGPIGGIAAEPTYLDVALANGGSFVQPIARGHSAFAYVFEGEARFAKISLRRRSSWSGAMEKSSKSARKNLRRGSFWYRASR
jgi:quercetin 2,3-dioxygenase